MLELPWPPKQITPNFKRVNHWTTYAPFTKQYRKDCGWLAKSIKPKIIGGKIGIKISFYPPDKRKRDDDGMIGAFKAGRDGLADAWGVDDNIFSTTYEICSPVKNGKVVVRFT